MATKDTKGAVKEAVKETADTEVKAEAKAEAPASAESVYSAEDLARGASNTFGTRPECVIAALKIAGKDSATIAEAKTIVDEFLAKEVKEAE